MRQLIYDLCLVSVAYQAARISAFSADLEGLPEEIGLSDSSCLGLICSGGSYKFFGLMDSFSKTGALLRVRVRCECGEISIYIDGHPRKKA